METTIRKGNKPFYGDAIFSHGISRSGYFNKRESEELQEYGATFEALLSGALAPDNEEESAFIAGMKIQNESDLYAVKLWNKYLQSVIKSKCHHGFMLSEASARSSQTIELEGAA